MPRTKSNLPRNSRRALSSAPSRLGLTLIELLVIIVILTLITSAAIPVMVVSQQGRRQRDAARMLTSFLNGARSRAIATGHAVGVVFEHELKVQQTGPRDPVVTTVITPDFVTRLSYTEMPPPWSGDTVDSTVAIVSASLCGPNALNPKAASCAVIPPWGFDQQDLSWRGQIRQGDRIRFNYEGKWYRLYAGDPWFDTNGNGVFDPGEDFLDWDYDGRCTHETLGLLLKDGYFHNKVFASFGGPMSGPPPKSPIYTFLGTDEPYDPINGSMPKQVRFAPPPASATGPIFPYELLSRNFEDPDGTKKERHPKFQIERQPARTASDVLQLPEGAGIDLYWSGMKGDSAFFGDADGVSGRAPDEIGQFRPMILFGPSGRVEYVYNGAAASRPAGSIFLLVGRTEGRMSIIADDPSSRIPLIPLRNYALSVKPPPQFVSNVIDSRSLWVAISPQNGLVTTAEVDLRSDIGAGPSGTLTAGDIVAIRRTFAKSGRSISGK